MNKPGVVALDWSCRKRKQESARQDMLVRAARRSLARSEHPNKIVLFEEDLSWARRRVGLAAARNKYADVWDARHCRLRFPDRILEQVPDGWELRIDQISSSKLLQMVESKELCLARMPKDSGSGYYILGMHPTTIVPDFSRLEAVDAAARPNLEAMHQQYALSSKKKRGASGEGDVLTNLDAYDCVPLLIEKLSRKNSWLQKRAAGKTHYGRMGRQNLAHVEDIGSVEMDEFYLQMDPKTGSFLTIGVEAKTDDLLSPSQIFQNLKASQAMYKEAQGYLCVGVKPVGDDLGLALYRLGRKDQVLYIGAIRVCTHPKAC